jgi:chromosome segregation ATPase
MTGDPVVTWPDCCQRLDELEAELEEAAAETLRLLREILSLRGHEAKLLAQVNDLGGDLTAARESEQHAWQIVENRDARLAELQRSVDAVIALCDSEGRLGPWVPISRVRDALDGEA